MWKGDTWDEKKGRLGKGLKEKGEGSTEDKKRKEKEDRAAGNKQGDDRGTETAAH